MAAALFSASAAILHLRVFRRGFSAWPRKIARSLGPRPPPKTPLPWDSIPLPDKGDANDATTFEAVGRAISSWEYFEAYLGLVFSALVDSDITVGGAMRAYGSVLSFSGRLSMVIAASEPHFLTFPHRPLEKRFTDLTKAAKGFSARRNEIAHGIVQPYFVKTEDRGFAVIPSYFASKKRSVLAGDTELGPLKTAFVYAYASKEIRDWTAHFHTLAQDTLNLYQSLVAARQAGKDLQQAKMLARLLADRKQPSAETTEPNPKDQKE